MKKAFTDEEMKSWRAEQPQKMVAAKVVIKSDRGNILTVQPSYKNTWQLPGGGVDDGESPEGAAVREVKEETGLNISVNDLILKGTIYKKDEELLLVLFEYKYLLEEDVIIQVEEGEISGYQFAPPAETASHLAEYYLEFWHKNYTDNLY